MAKRRILKKEISYVAGELFTEALVCKLSKSRESGCFDGSYPRYAR